MDLDLRAAVSDADAARLAVVFVGELPHKPTGKVIKCELEQLKQ